MKEHILNETVKNMQPSGIRKFFDIVAEMKDAISLGVGEPDFVTPWHIREAGIYSLEKGHTYYTSNAGLLELREAICEYMQRRFQLQYTPKNQVLVTVGGSEALDLCIRSLINPGDEVLIPEPSFVCYTPTTQLAYGVPVPIVTKAENEFRVTAQQIKEKITNKTKLLILPFPNNPTGAIMERQHLEEIADVLRGTDIMILSDEIYGELTYGQKHVSIANIDDMYDRTVVVGGFSKAYAMTGWRLGFALGSPEIIGAMTKVHQYAIMSSPTMSQYAGMEAMKFGDNDIEKMKEEYNMRRRFILDGFRSMGLSCFEPKGAFYVFPSIRETGLTSNAFCDQLLKEEKVAVVPGNAFGQSGEGFVRCSYAYSVEKIEEALERIGRFVKKRL